MISSSGAVDWWPTATELARGMNIKAAPKPEKPRAKPAMKAAASRNSTALPGWPAIDRSAMLISGQLVDWVCQCSHAMEFRNEIVWADHGVSPVMDTATLRSILAASC